jgi:hypothetical protein
MENLLRRQMWLRVKRARLQTLLHKGINTIDIVGGALQREEDPKKVALGQCFAEHSRTIRDELHEVKAELCFLNGILKRNLKIYEGRHEMKTLDPQIREYFEKLNE